MMQSETPRRAALVTGGAALAAPPVWHWLLRA